jgi:hypothetical protein
VAAAGSLKQAENRAAGQMMELIRKGQTVTHAVSPTTCTSPTHSLLLPSGSLSNPVGELDELLRKEHSPLSTYTDAVSSGGPPHAPDFSRTCSTLFGSTAGQGKTKKAAKNDAAAKMLTLVREKISQRLAASPATASAASASPPSLPPDLLSNPGIKNQLPANFSFLNRDAHQQRVTYQDQQFPLFRPMTSASTISSTAASDQREAAAAPKSGSSFKLSNMAAAGDTAVHHVTDEDKENEILFQFADAIQDYDRRNKKLFDKLYDIIEFNNNQDDGNFHAHHLLASICDSLAAEYQLKSGSTNGKYHSVVRVYKQKVVVAIASASSGVSQSASESDAIKRVLMQFATRL